MRYLISALAFLVLCNLSALAFTTSSNIFEVNHQDTILSFEVKVGERVSDLFSRLEKDGITTANDLSEIFNSGVFDSSFKFLPSHIDGVIRLEGIFVPKTYEITISDIPSGYKNNSENAYSILNHLLETASVRFNNSDLNRGLNIYDILILSSIVEKEDAFDTHAGIIASVFWNRLAKNGRLGSCVTVEYLLGYHRPFLLFKDLDIVASSPWSTYHQKGLPPTPICFSSDYTIDETIQAEKTNYYYFVMDWVKKTPYLAVKYETHLENSRVAKQSVIDVYGSGIIHQKMENNYYDYFSKINSDK
jgi:UPF0755 protein